MSPPALATLVPDELGPQAPGSTGAPAFRRVPIDQITPNPEQPRRSFDTLELEALASSIATHGVLTPLVVRSQRGRYVLIAGERRLRAASLAGLTEVPVIVREADHGAESLELALVENLQRADLDPVDAALGFARLMEAYGYSQDDVARAVGRDRSTIANALRLLRLPDFALAALREGRITAGHARALLGIQNPSAIKRVLTRVVTHGLSVRRTEEIVARLRRQVAESPPVPDRYRHASEALRDALHTDVSVRPKKRGGGKITIAYGTDEELDRLVQQLRTA